MGFDPEVFGVGDRERRACSVDFLEEIPVGLKSRIWKCSVVGEALVERGNHTKVVAIRREGDVGGKGLPSIEGKVVEESEGGQQAPAFGAVRCSWSKAGAAIPG